MAEVAMRLCSVNTLIDILCAAHLTRWCVTPYESRGGIMMVAPPGTLKTSIVKAVWNSYPDAVMLSDVNNKSLMSLKDDIASNKIGTLGLFDLQKLYERDQRTAHNVEGTLRALADEGFTNASYQDARVQTLTARALVVGAVPPWMPVEFHDRWYKSGFKRRFLWAMYGLRDPMILTESVIRQRKLAFGSIHIPIPANRSIPVSLSEQERRKLLPLLKWQSNETVPLQLLCKIGDVLAWHYQETRRGSKVDVMKKLHEFGHLLSKEGGYLTLEE